MGKGCRQLPQLIFEDCLNDCYQSYSVVKKYLNLTQ